MNSLLSILVGCLFLCSHLTTEIQAESSRSKRKSAYYLNTVKRKTLQRKRRRKVRRRRRPSRTLMTKSLKRKRRRTRRRRRRIASLYPNQSRQSSIKYATKNSESTPLQVRLGIMGGLSSASSPQRAAGSYNNNIAIGGLADIQYGFIGLEADAFYGIAPTVVSNTGQNSIFGTATQEERKLQQSGAFLNAKVQHAFKLGSVVLTPKLGFGYAFLNQSLSITDGLGTRTADQSISGAYGLFGFDLLLFSKIILAADFANSLFSSGSLQLGSTNLEIDDPSFNRLRIGAYFKASDHFIAGGQYVRRTFELDSSEVQSQILAILMFQL